MTYQLSTLVSEIRQRAKDNSFSDSLIISYIQETQDEVLGRYRLPYLEEVLDDAVAASSSEYELDTDEIQVILSLRLVNTSSNQVLKPTYIAYNEFFDTDVQTTTATRPELFTLFAKKLYFRYPLDFNYQFSLKYLRRPIQLVEGTNVPDIPVEFKEILVRGGLAGVEEFRENYDIAALHRRKVEDLSEDMVARYTTRQLITPHIARFGRSR